MQNTLKSLVSMGVALAASPIARSIMNPSAPNALAWVGLERRSSRILERTALVGVGAIVGAGAALLLAPASGAETRRKLGEKANALSEEAKNATERAAGYLQEAVDAGLKEKGTSNESGTHRFAAQS